MGLHEESSKAEKRYHEKIHDYILIRNVIAFIADNYKIDPYQALLKLTTTEVYVDLRNRWKTYTISFVPYYDRGYFDNLLIDRVQFAQGSFWHDVDEVPLMDTMLSEHENIKDLKGYVKDHLIEVCQYYEHLLWYDEYALNYKNETELGEMLRDYAYNINNNPSSDLQKIINTCYYKRTHIEQALGLKLPDIESYDVHIANTDDTCAEEIASLTSRITEPKMKNLELDRKLLNELKKSVAPKSRSCYLNIILALKEILLEKEVFKNQAELEAYLYELYDGYQGLTKSNLGNVFAMANKLK